MAYKARRTRDLQGEVKAGTGISVTESVNPDGTKVYTLENTAPGGGNEFDEIKIIDGETVKVLIDTDGVHLFNDDGNDVGVFVHDEIILRDEEGNHRVAINRNGTISLVNDEGNETFWFNYEDGNFYLRNNLGNDKFIVEEDGNLTTLRLYDQDGNVILNSESLVDMVNATASITIATNSFSYGTTKYRRLDPDTGLNYLVEPNNIRSEGDYYDYDGQAGTAGGTFDLGGIRFAYAGLYKITINWNCWTGSANDITRHIDIHRGDDIVYPDYIDERTYHPCQEQGGGDYYQEITESIMLDLQAEDILVIYWTMDGYGSLDSEHQPIFNIQKLC